MPHAHVVLDRDFTIGETDPRLFGAFVEHMGRCVYGGIYEPGHPTADAHGLRGDVLALVRELGVTMVRYPGGNFVSGYTWEDGVGPKQDRPRKHDLAWFSTEPNTFGTDEFMTWCRVAHVEPMLAVNLGTRGGEAARNLVEYCNHAGDTHFAALRRRNGTDMPHGVKLWCLGNEMDGPWQIERKTATEYGRIAAEAAKLMTWVDPTIQLAACGSTSRQMPTFGRWDDEVLEHTFEHVDYLSLHTYLAKRDGDTAAFLASSDLMDRFIEEVVAVADAVAARRRSKKRIKLSFDEWNVWYRTKVPTAPTDSRPWPVAPPIHEEVYTMEDALAFGGACISLLNHADRVKAACLAQLVNILAPIMTETGGPAWRQTIFHPFAHMSRHGRGRVLRSKIECETYPIASRDQPGATEEVPFLKLAAIATAAGGCNLLVVNRYLRRRHDVSIDSRGFGPLVVAEALEMHDIDLDAVNSKSAPTRVVPRPANSARSDGRHMRLDLAPASWNVIRLTPAA